MHWTFGASRTCMPIELGSIITTGSRPWGSLVPRLRPGNEANLGDTCSGSQNISDVVPLFVLLKPPHSEKHNMSESETNRHWPHWRQVYDRGSALMIDYTSQLSNVYIQTSWIARQQEPPPYINFLSQNAPMKVRMPHTQWCPLTIFIFIYLFIFYNNSVIIDKDACT